MNIVKMTNYNKIFVKFFVQRFITVQIKFKIILYIIQYTYIQSYENKFNALDLRSMVSSFWFVFISKSVN